MIKNILLQLILLVLLTGCSNSEKLLGGDNPIDTNIIPDATMKMAKRELDINYTDGKSKDGNAFLIKHGTPIFPVWDLSNLLQSAPQNKNKHLIEKVHLDSGLYFGDRNTEPRAALVAHFIINPNPVGSSKATNTNDCKPLDIFVVNLHLTTLMMEREGVPEIDVLATNSEEYRHGDLVGWQGLEKYYESLLKDTKGVFVAASDYVKAMPQSIAKWIPGSFAVLGTDGYGRSDGRDELRDFFEVDERYIVVATLYQLFLEGTDRLGAPWHCSRAPLLLQARR